MCTHIHSQRGKLSLEGTRKLGLLTPKGERAHARTSRRNSHSSEDAEGTQSQKVSMGNVSIHRDSLQSQACCSNSLRGSLARAPFIVWLDLTCGHLWSVLQKFLSAEAPHWLGPCPLTKGSHLAPSHHGGTCMTRVMVSQPGCGGQH